LVAFAKSGELHRSLARWRSAGRVDVLFRLGSPSRTRTGTTVRSEDFKSETDLQQDTHHSGFDAGRDTPSSAIERGGPPETVGVGQVPDDERALSESILRAARAEVWEVVQSLTAELRARRLARVAPDVTSLEAERAKRDGKR
jgi:hypothetical protein